MNMEELKKELAKARAEVSHWSGNVTSLIAQVEISSDVVKILGKHPTRSESDEKRLKVLDVTNVASSEAAEADLAKANEQPANAKDKLEKAQARVKEFEAYLRDSANREDAFWPVNESVPGIASFISRQLRDELTNLDANNDGPIRRRLRADSEERILELVDNLEGLRRGRKRLYVRDSMRSIVSRIISHLEEDPDQWLLLGGTSGCGKSVVGLLAVILLAAKGHVVLYSHRGATMLLLTEKVSDEDKKTLDKVIQRVGISPIPLSNRVWNVGSLHGVHVSFQRIFRRIRNFIFVQDLNDQSDSAQVPPEDGAGKRLIISGPDTEKLEIIRKKYLAKVIVMPAWTLDELKGVEAVDPDSVEKRFERVGGNARWVLDSQKGSTEYTQDNVIEALPMDLLALVCEGNSYLALPSELELWWSQLIFRVEPRTETNDERCQVMLASPYVAERLATRFLKGTESEILRFATVVQRNRRLSELRGRILEGAVHRAIKQGREGWAFNTMSIFRLNDTEAPIPVLTDTLTMTFDTIMEFVDIPNIPQEQLRKGSYFYAKRKDKAIDSFALADEEFVKTYFPNHPALNVSFGSGFKSEKLFIIFIQTTIANEHVIDGSILRKRREELREKLRLPKLPMVYSFISWPWGITRRQLVTHATARKSPFRNQDEFGPQYVIQLKGKFNEVVERIAY